jgi:hypothetical protein
MGEADTMVITGGMVSMTVTVVPQELERPEESVTVMSIVFVPKGNWPENETSLVVGGVPAGT